VEPATPGPPRDRERQKLAGTVRLLQPMGAGGRRPPVDHPAWSPCRAGAGECKLPRL